MATLAEIRQKLVSMNQIEVQSTNGNAIYPNIAEGPNITFFNDNPTNSVLTERLMIVSFRYKRRDQDLYVLYPWGMYGEQVHSRGNVCPKMLTRR